MKSEKVKIELLINPFCLCDRDFSRLSEICTRHKVTFDTYNLWDIDDEDVYGLPEYMSSLIREWRSGQRAGSVYSNVFINGKRIPINKWHESSHIIEEEIVDTLRGTEK